MSNRRRKRRDSRGYAPNLLDWEWKRRAKRMKQLDEAYRSLRSDSTQSGNLNNDEVDSSAARSSDSSRSNSPILFTDDELDDLEGAKDREAFGHSGITNYGEILHLKHKSKRKCKISLGCWSCVKALGRAGLFLSRADHLLGASFAIDSGTSRECFRLFFRGPFEKHSLRNFSLRAIRNAVSLDGDMNMKYIAGYLRSSASLRHLKLCSLGLNSDALSCLASGLKEARLRSLTFCRIGSKEECLSAFLVSLNASDLKILNLENCAVGGNVCGILAEMLKGKDSVLEGLILDNSVDARGEVVSFPNNIDDGCVDILCESLANNTTFFRLGLCRNDRITHIGWERFERLLFDTTSLDSTSRSNHTLGSIAGNPRSNETPNLERNNLIDVLLRMNNTVLPAPYSRRETMALRKRLKIAKYLTIGDVFNTAAFDCVSDVKLMPYVLAFLARERPSRSDEYDGAFFTMDALYAILRAWDMPTLFEFPSRERIQLTAEIGELKAEVDRIRKFNQELTSDNARLRAENKTLLDGKTHGAKHARIG